MRILPKAHHQALLLCKSTRCVNERLGNECLDIKSREFS